MGLDTKNVNASIVVVSIIILWFFSDLKASDFQASPGDYKQKLSSLQSGDRLILSPGVYDHFTVQNLNGNPEHWITITGSDEGEVVIQADPGPCCNTIEIVNSSYVSIENLTVDGMGVEGAFGISAKGGESNRVHHIKIEACTFIHHDAGQQTDAISTKTPTWGWIIRKNRIIGAGTGMYLGNSNGTYPFIAGLIEYNIIDDPLGYCMEIKWQQPWPDVQGMPTEPSSTIIRHNVFIKSDRPSPSGDRPNILVGGLPSDGPGSQNMYEIYGNFFYHNPRESLIQVSGRVSIHDNIFVDVAGTAIRLQNHDLPMRMARVYNNTIYYAGQGIDVSGTLDQGAWVVGNLIFADTPIHGSAQDQRDNITDSIDAASSYVANPSTVLGEMDLFPLQGACQGPAMDLAAFSQDADFDRDFNGTQKGQYTFRGAYAGQGSNPGWSLDDNIKNMVDDSSDGGMSDAGMDAGDSGADPATDGGSAYDKEQDASADENRDGDETAEERAEEHEPSASHSVTGGCACTQSGENSSALWMLLLLFALWASCRFTAQRPKTR